MATVGCDPEFTILDPRGRPVPASAVGITEKVDMPPKQYVPEDHRGMHMARSLFFRDGWNVEVNVKGGACRALMLNGVSAAVDLIRSNLPEGYKLVARAAFRVPKKALDAAPDDVKHFGCNPSIDAYTGKRKIPDVDAATHLYRYAGGHLHFGTEFNSSGHKCIVNAELNPMLVKLFDKYIGLPLAVIYNDSAQWRRRKLYGQAGEYRRQQYDPYNVGVEYRTPPAELFNHYALVSLFLGVGRIIIHNFDMLSREWDKSIEPALVSAINTGKNAKELLYKLNVQIPKMFSPDTIIALSELPDVHEFTLGDKHDAHIGWTEFARTSGLSLTLPSTWKPEEDVKLRMEYGYDPGGPTWRQNVYVPVEERRP